MDPLKSGKTTSEFWLMILYSVIFVANGTSYVHIPWDQFALYTAVVFGYNGGRALIKNTVAKINGKEKPNA